MFVCPHKQYYKGGGWTEKGKGTGQGSTRMDKHLPASTDNRSYSLSGFL